MDIGIWIAKDRNGKVSMHKKLPERNEVTGKWISKDPYCNCIAQKQMQRLLERSSITWNSDPEYIELSFD